MFIMFKNCGILFVMIICFFDFIIDNFWYIMLFVVVILCKSDNCFMYILYF